MKVAHGHLLDPHLILSSARRVCSSSSVSRAYLAGGMRRFGRPETPRGSMYSRISPRAPRRGAAARLVEAADAPPAPGPALRRVVVGEERQRLEVGVGVADDRLRHRRAVARELDLRPELVLAELRLEHLLHLAGRLRVEEGDLAVEATGALDVDVEL